MITILSALYNLAWFAALPFLKRSSRIACGWKQRILRESPQGPFDLWIQAASGGEALLADMIIRSLDTSLSTHKTLRILITSGTRQGVETLQKIAQNSLASQLTIDTAYFPFDAPFLMKKAFHHFSPGMAVIIETELWPGFLIAAKKADTPVLLVNGRMSEKSYRSYRLINSFFMKYGPDTILAVSEADKKRFSRTVSNAKIEIMNNIKFDRIKIGVHEGTNSLSGITPDHAFLVLGSIRREEEGMVLKTIEQVLEKRPETVIGLFPKHMERTDPWLKLLSQAGIPSVKRSLVTNNCPAGTVIIWDRFGELQEAYRLAGAAFVGGSLVDLGGQNFLEPLFTGLSPVTGPYLENFAWVDSSIFSSGLVRQVADENELAKQLIYDLTHPGDRKRVLEQAKVFLEPKRGGTKQACAAILETLSTIQKQ